MKKEVKNKVQNKTENSATDAPEETVISSEENLTEVNEKSAVEFEDIVAQMEAESPTDTGIEFTDTAFAPEVKETEPKTPAENAADSSKQKIKALKRAIENKTFSIEREEIKVKDWRVQANDRDKLATEEYEKKKSALEDALKKNQERFEKRMAKTKKWWHEYADNHELTKIKKLRDELTLLQTELQQCEPELSETK